MRSFFWALSAAVTFVASNAGQAATVTIDFDNLSNRRGGFDIDVVSSSGTPGTDSFLLWRLSRPGDSFNFDDRASSPRPANYGRTSLDASFAQDAGAPIFLSFSSRTASSVMIDFATLVTPFRAVLNAYTEADGQGSLVASASTDIFRIPGSTTASNGQVSLSGNNIKSIGFFAGPISGDARSLLWFDNVKLTFDDEDPPVAAVPLPASVMNLGMGFALIAALPFLRRRRARKAT